MRREARVPLLPFPFSHFMGRAENRSRSCGRPVGHERAGPHLPGSWGHLPPRTHSPRCGPAHARELGPQARTCSSSAAGGPRVTCLLKRHSSQDTITDVHALPPPPPPASCAPTFPLCTCSRASHAARSPPGLTNLSPVPVELSHEHDNPIY